MFFDTHAHYDDEAFDSDRDEVLSSMAGGGVDLIVDPATNLDSCAKAREIAERYDFVYFAAGLHPNDLWNRYYEGYLEDLRPFLDHPKCVAVGEIGLDYHYGAEFKELSHRVLREQLELAHEREATRDFLDIIGDYRDVTGVVHCFSGSWETAREILELGWYISFTGVVTFKNARRAVEVAEKMPIERLMIETDSPYMSPEPVRGRRNSSLNVRYIAEKIAALRGMTTEELAEVTMENGKRFFGIG